MTRDMTVGNPVKLIISFSLALVIGNLFQQAYSLLSPLALLPFLLLWALPRLVLTDWAGRY